ncbi:acyl-CoA thioesterase [Candidatus Bathyarchaeota archaeon CG07_land_8_20_14_0_80_47_9]|jgi:YbgC/YbaW family acyl-CoA thioester hydrolase|nr:MAG: acyl-CoA thioesterase [Candidatus Bathyarchaeota archaeon CG07_land_8_20_14_0_80_47_9]
MSSKTFKASFRVSWADTDAAQVVHFSNYLRFFEKAEEEFYRHLGFSFTDAKLTRGLWFPRVEVFCQYKKPARFNDTIEVELSIEKLKEKSVKYDFKIVNKKTGVLLANGYAVIVAADKQTGKATQIPNEIVEKLKPFTK